MSDKSWLKNTTPDPQSIETLYDDWAVSYDDQLTTWDYRAPREAARLLGAWGVSAETDILDAGCGTGLTGQALAAQGFNQLTGIDLSQQSLMVAAQRDVYQRLRHADLSQRLPFDDGQFGAVQCVGVMTYVHPAEPLFREMIRVTEPNGIILFTQRDDIALERGFRQSVETLVEEGLWQLVLYTEPQPYLPDSPDIGDKHVHYVVCRKAAA